MWVYKLVWYGYEMATFKTNIPCYPKSAQVALTYYYYFKNLWHIKPRIGVREICGDKKKFTI